MVTFRSRRRIQRRMAPRADTVRRQMRIALGLWPWPTKTPLNAVIHGCIDQGEYTVEKVFFESMPGFFVTGNLYRQRANRAVPGGARAARTLADARSGCGRTTR